MLQRLIPIRLRVSIRKILRHIRNLFDRRDFVYRNDQTYGDFKEVLAQRESLLLKKVPEEYEELQRNKIKTLQIATALVDGLVVRPGEYFSFWRIVGKPSARKGYTLGFELQGGKLIKSIAGGLCQLTNALCFTAINSGMKVVERHRHGLDLFRDHNRDVPFGSGATVLYNFKDFVFKNDQDFPVQIRACVNETHLAVSICAQREPGVFYRMEEREHKVYNQGEKKFRYNEIWQIAYREEDIISENLVFKNNAELMYDWEGE